MTREQETLRAKLRQRPFFHRRNDPAVEVLQIFFFKRAVLRLEENT